MDSPATRLTVTGADFLSWSGEAESFSGVAAVSARGFKLAGDGEPERVEGALLSRVLSGLLFGVSRIDPLTFLGWPLALTAVAAGAAWIAARRASSVDPAIALRHE